MRVFVYDFFSNLKSIRSFMFDVSLLVRSLENPLFYLVPKIYGPYGVEWQHIAKAE